MSIERRSSNNESDNLFTPFEQLEQFLSEEDTKKFRIKALNKVIDLGYTNSLIELKIDEVTSFTTNTLVEYINWDRHREAYKLGRQLEILYEKRQEKIDQIDFDKRFPLIYRYTKYYPKAQEIFDSYKEFFKHNPGDKTGEDTTQVDRLTALNHLQCDMIQVQMKNSKINKT